MNRLSIPAVISPFTFSSVAVFLFGALCLIAPSGYSWGSALLALGGLFILFRKHQWPEFTRDDVKIMLAIGLFATLWLLEVALESQGWSRAERPLKFYAAIIATFFLFKYPPKIEYFWAGIATGAIGAGVWAAWQGLFEGISRARGFTHLIQYGNISLLLGVLSLAGLGWALQRENNKHRWVALLIFGFIFGLLGSAFTGARGGWVALPFVAVVLYIVYRDFLNKKLLFTSIGLLLIFITAIYLIPATGVQKRVNIAVTELNNFYEKDVRTSSVGIRLEMWRASFLLIPEKPIFGWGRKGYEAERDRMIEEKIVHKNIGRFTSVHNEFIDTTLKRGFIGLISLLMMYLLPVFLFKKGIRATDAATRSLAAAGILLPVCFMSFGLTQVFFSHNSGVMVYSFMLVIIWTIFSRLETEHD
ncbi:MAG: O-antigen ligase family protein [Rhodohalobacter sp.]|uniref:O-antigen ligase family protein n=1 Tax=Rhodohalobacter sp. TaxID=1974210 RepID=UPI0039768139